MATLPPSPFFSSAECNSAETLAVATGPQASDAAVSGPFDSGAPVALAPDEAVALPSFPGSAAADIPEPTTDGGGPERSPAPGQELCGAGDLEALVGEIFRETRRLNLPRFKLDEQAFMEAIEPPPLFLQAAQ